MQWHLLWVLWYSSGVRPSTFQRWSLFASVYVFMVNIRKDVFLASHTDDRGTQIPGTGLPMWLNFVQWHLVFSVCACWVFFHIFIKNVYQYTYTMQKVPENSEVQGALQNCVSSVRNLSHVTFPVHRTKMWHPEFFENLQTQYGNV
jgi:hypothetical protein